MVASGERLRVGDTRSLHFASDAEKLLFMQRLPAFCFVWCVCSPFPSLDLHIDGYIQDTVEKSVFSLLLACAVVPGYGRADTCACKRCIVVRYPGTLPGFGF